MKRWKEGIKQVVLTMPPQKQNDSQIKFTWIMLVGLILGLIISLINLKTLFWLAIILFAAIGNTIVQLFALYQKRKALEQFASYEEILNVKEKQGDTLQNGCKEEKNEKRTV